MIRKNLFNFTSQLAIPILTISAQMAVAMKNPQLSLVLNLLAQPFWIYSSWQAYKKADQVGIFATTIIFTIVTLAGIVNYWFF